jgi:hypothetical protein
VAAREKTSGLGIQAEQCHAGRKSECQLDGRATNRTFWTETCLERQEAIVRYVGSQGLADRLPSLTPWVTLCYVSSLRRVAD